METTTLDPGKVLSYLGIFIAVTLVLALVFMAYVFWRVRRIQLPPGADFFTALRHTPLSVVILLDLLDLSLDIFSAPVSWIILGRLGLEPLRAVTMVESVIPGTQALPTMTIAWIIARFWKNAPRIPNQLPW
jgi:hypothetical protein